MISTCIKSLVLEEALNAGAYYPEGTAACYSTYLKILMLLLVVKLISLQTSNLLKESQTFLKNR